MRSGQYDPHQQNRLTPTAASRQSQMLGLERKMKMLRESYRRRAAGMKPHNIDDAFLSRMAGQKAHEIFLRLSGGRAKQSSSQLAGRSTRKRQSVPDESEVQIFGREELPRPASFAEAATAATQFWASRRTRSTMNMNWKRNSHNGSQCDPGNEATYEDEVQADDGRFSVTQARMFRHGRNQAVLGHSATGVRRSKGRLAAQTQFLVDFQSLTQMLNWPAEAAGEDPAINLQQILKSDTANEQDNAGQAAALGGGGRSRRTFLNIPAHEKNSLDSEFKVRPMPLQDSVMKANAIEEDQSRHESNSRENCASCQEDRLSPRSPRSRRCGCPNAEAGEPNQATGLSFRFYENDNPLTQLSQMTKMQEGSEYGEDPNRRSMQFKPLVPKEYQNQAFNNMRAVNKGKNRLDAEGGTEGSLIRGQAAPGSRRFLLAHQSHTSKHSDRSKSGTATTSSAKALTQQAQLQKQPTGGADLPISLQVPPNPEDGGGLARRGKQRIRLHSKKVSYGQTEYQHEEEPNHELAIEHQMSSDHFDVFLNVLSPMKDQYGAQRKESVIDQIFKREQQSHEGGGKVARVAKATKEAHDLLDSSPGNAGRRTRHGTRRLNRSIPSQEPPAKHACAQTSRSPPLRMESDESTPADARLLMERTGFKAQPLISTKSRGAQQLTQYVAERRRRRPGSPRTALRNSKKYQESMSKRRGIDLPQQRAKTPLQITQIRSDSIKILDYNFDVIDKLIRDKNNQHRSSRSKERRCVRVGGARGEAAQGLVGASLSGEASPRERTDQGRLRLSPDHCRTQYLQQQNDYGFTQGLSNMPASTMVSSKINIFHGQLDQHEGPHDSKIKSRAYSLQSGAEDGVPRQQREPSVEKDSMKYHEDQSHVPAPLNVAQRAEDYPDYVAGGQNLVQDSNSEEQFLLDQSPTRTEYMQWQQSIGSPQRDQSQQASPAKLLGQSTTHKYGKDLDEVDDILRVSSPELSPPHRESSKKNRFQNLQIHDISGSLSIRPEDYIEKEEAAKSAAIAVPKRPLEVPRHPLKMMKSSEAHRGSAPSQVASKGARTLQRTSATANSKKTPIDLKTQKRSSRPRGHSVIPSSQSSQASVAPNHMVIAKYSGGQDGQATETFQNIALMNIQNQMQAVFARPAVQSRRAATNSELESRGPKMPSHSQSMTEMDRGQRPSLQEFRRSIELINKSTNNFLMDSMQEFKIQLDGEKPRLTKVLQNKEKDGQAKLRIQDSMAGRIDDLFKLKKAARSKESASLSLMARLQGKMQQAVAREKRIIQKQKWTDSGFLNSKCQVTESLYRNYLLNKFKEHYQQEKYSEASRSITHIGYKPAPPTPPEALVEDDPKKGMVPQAAWKPSTKISTVIKLQLQKRSSVLERNSTLKRQVQISPEHQPENEDQILCSTIKPKNNEDLFISPQLTQELLELKDRTVEDPPRRGRGKKAQEENSNNSRSDLATTSEQMHLTPRSMGNEFEGDVIDALIQKNRNPAAHKQGQKKSHKAAHRSEQQSPASEGSLRQKRASVRKNSVLERFGRQKPSPADDGELQSLSYSASAMHDSHIRKPINAHADRSSAIDHTPGSAAIKEIVIYNQTTGSAVQSDRRSYSQSEQSRTRNVEPMSKHTTHDEPPCTAPPYHGFAQKLTSSYVCSSSNKPLIELRARHPVRPPKDSAADPGGLTSGSEVDIPFKNCHRQYYRRRREAQHTPSSTGPVRGSAVRVQTEPDRQGKGGIADLDQRW